MLLLAVERLHAIDERRIYFNKDSSVTFIVNFGIEMDPSASSNNNNFRIGQSIVECKQKIKLILLHQEAIYEPCNADIIQKFTEHLKNE